MKKTLFLTTMIAVCMILGALFEAAEARRMGGGKSFGSKPQYQSNAPQPQRPDQGAASQRQAGPQQGAAPAAAASPASRFGGLGGMFGGLLMGGLLGSLLFGGGAHGAGGGIGFLEILLIGGGLFLLFRFLRSRKLATQTAGPMAYQSPGHAFGGGTQAAPQEIPAKAVPAGFDEAEFLKGAKMAYSRLQKSWDKRDLEDIRQFTSPEVWETIRQQAEEDPHPGQTGIVYIEAILQEVKTLADHTVASVLFDVLLREDGQEEAQKVQEIWHFRRDDSTPGSHWVLEGIQQVD